MKRFSLYIAALLSITLASCSKDTEDIIPEYFYGKWKASYGDTVVFSRANGLNIATYNYSMNVAMPMRDDREFSYREGKLGIKLWAPGDFRFFSSFRWIQEGRSFEIQGIEWFSFMSSSIANFTFTRIP